MILVTGGTTAIGRAVLRHLTGGRHAVRTLLKPTSDSPVLPIGVPVEIALSSLMDRRGMRASVVGVDTVIHLAGDMSPGEMRSATVDEVDAARILAEVAAEAGVRRLVLLSHIGADRSSAYSYLRLAAVAEDFVRSSGISYTILRSAILFGEEDHFTTSLAKLLDVSPLIFPLPGEGTTLMQPLSIEDLAACMSWMLDDEATKNQTFEVGGPEFLSLVDIVRLIMDTLGQRRALVPVSPPFLRTLVRLQERVLPRPPMRSIWMDYLASNRTAALDTLPRVFGLRPRRMEGALAYLKGRSWGWEMLSSQFRRGSGER